MKLEEMTIEELETLSYTDLTYLILKENKQPMNTAALFQKICDLLGYDKDYYTESIGDYYTSLTIDKRFVNLETNEWDIRDHHSIEVNMDDDDFEDDLIDEDEEDDDNDDFEEDTEEIDDNFDESIDDLDDLDDDEDDLDELEFEGLTILPEDELED